MRSYPTYEEWKQFKRVFPYQLSFCSYPTYEEWKLGTRALFLPRPSSRSYPTYEEWKPSSTSSPLSSLLLFLSYL